MRTKIGQIDLDTGEVLEGVIAYVPPKKNGFRRFLSMNQEGLLNLSRNELSKLSSNDQLNGTDYSVLFCLLAHVDYENHILVSQTEMAKRIDMARSHFNKSLHKFIKLGIIEKGPRMGRILSLRLNPNFGWKGSSKNHVIELDEKRQKK